MTEYVGTKRVNGRKMTRQEYNDYRGWKLPSDEDGTDEGYLVEYLDGGKPNHPDHTGYISWSPKLQFENAYKDVSDGFDFGEAIRQAKAGQKVARRGWNGKGMFVVMMGGLKLPPFSTQEAGPKVNDRTAKFIGEDTPLNSQPYFAMFTAQKTWQPGWLCSQADMLADDWGIV